MMKKIIVKDVKGNVFRYVIFDSLYKKLVTMFGERTSFTTKEMHQMQMRYR